MGEILDLTDNVYSHCCGGTMKASFDAPFGLAQDDASRQDHSDRLAAIADSVMIFVQRARISPPKCISMN